MFLEGLGGSKVQNDKQSPSYAPTLKKKRDTTRIGDLVVPSIGIGTIAWSSKSRK